MPSLLRRQPACRKRSTPCRRAAAGSARAVQPYPPGIQISPGTAAAAATARGKAM
ncbi:Protein of unknown function [Thermobacillus xylanilyticus]|uniref:Uncharacterized protein n=1 Tax=Thermobacillus xylanilyticus TaxID=76633 RepID=A0ABN7RQ06_THEXY|nr:Protein of unknown function [Thermobacillus xylanilyticus]